MELTNDFEVNVPVEQAWAVLTDVERIAPCMPGAQLQEVEGDEYRGIVKVKVGPITAQYKGKASFVEKDDSKHVAVLKADGRDTRGQGNASALITATLEGSGDSTKVSVHTDLTVTGKVAQFGRGVMADVSAKLLDQFVENLETTVLAGDTETSAPEAGDAAAAHVTEAAEAETSENASLATPEAVEGTSSPNGSSATPATAPATPPVETTSAAKSSATPADAPATAPVGAKSGVRKIDHAEPSPVDLIGTAGMPVVKRVVPAIAVLVILALLWRWLSGRDHD